MHQGVETCKLVVLAVEVNITTRAKKKFDT